MTYTVPASVTVKMTLRKRLFRTAKEALSRHEECSSAMRNGLPRIAGKPVWQTVGDKNGHGYVFSCNADAVLRRFRFCFAVFRCQYFLLLKTHKYTFLHLLTLSPPHFSLFTSLIFYPFTFKNLIFPLPFYLFTLLIFIFSPSCSFSLIVKKYLFSVIFIPISLFCFHKSINFAEV